MGSDSEIQPTFICKFPSGTLVLCDMQHLPGYCILKAEPTVASLNDLPDRQRAQFLLDMACVGDVLIQHLNAYRINYAIFGNSDQYLHAHIVPRYLTEPEQYRHNTPWSYPPEVIQRKLFDPKRDAKLIALLAEKLTDLPN